MPRVTYARNSPYADTPQTSWYLAHYVHRPVPADASDRRLTLSSKYTHRPDLLSYDLYGTPAYYWTFMVRNMDVIREMPWDFVGGIELYVATRNRLKELGY